MKAVSFDNPIDIIVEVAVTQEIFDKFEDDFGRDSIVSVDTSNDLFFLDWKKGNILLTYNSVFRLDQLTYWFLNNFCIYDIVHTSTYLDSGL